MPTRRVDRTAEWAPGTGALCAEAQADGVPCTEVGRACETCERALADWTQAGGFGHPELRRDQEPSDA